MSDEKSETAPSCKRKRNVGNSGRCVKQRAKKGYGKKRKCYKYVKKTAEMANQSESTRVVDPQSMESTASFSKVQDIPDGNNTENIMSVIV